MAQQHGSLPRVDSSKGPHRVNRAHWPTKENNQIFNIVRIFLVHEKMPEMAPNGARRCFSLLIQTLPTFWAERIWILIIFFWTQISGSPNSQISRFPDFQTPPAPDELSDPNLTPPPTHPGIKYVARALAAINFGGSQCKLV